LVRRLARVAGIQEWQRLSPHSLRHSAITFASDAGATLRDVQDGCTPASGTSSAVVAWRTRTRGAQPQPLIS
jgi:integrase